MWHAAGRHGADRLVRARVDQRHVVGQAIGDVRVDSSRLSARPQARLPAVTVRLTYGWRHRPGHMVGASQADPGSLAVAREHDPDRRDVVRAHAVDRELQRRLHVLAGGGVEM